MTDFMEFVSSRLDENGFIVGTNADWVFIDWADIDKTGATSFWEEFSPDHPWQSSLGCMG